MFFTPPAPYAHPLVLIEQGSLASQSNFEYEISFTRVCTQAHDRRNPGPAPLQYKMPMRTLCAEAEIYQGENQETMQVLVRAPGPGPAGPGPGLRARAPGLGPWPGARGARAWDRGPD